MAQLREHADCRHMALALEGLAGALHAGQRVEPEDIGTAATAAGTVWAVGPEPSPERNQEFQEWRAQLIACAEAGARVGPSMAGQVARAAQAMALQLRWTAQDVHGGEPRAALPVATTRAMAGLMAEFGRYGQRVL